MEVGAAGCATKGWKSDSEGRSVTMRSESNQSERWNTNIETFLHASDFVRYCKNEERIP